MLFNSIEFAIFLPIVFALYWIAGRSRTAQNILLLVASYVFYGWWDWRFLILIATSSLVDFFVGIALDREEKPARRKLIFAASLAVNLGMLGFFKYFNFFVDSFAQAFTFFGAPLTGPSLSIILPVGISFYTFQALSYTIDVYRRQIPATHNPITFFAFISFFPQLVAGPIERAKNLLPQFEANRKFSAEAGFDGLKQIAWGLFKKIAIADTLALAVDPVFAAPGTHGSVTLAIAALFFAVQLYADFSGYSDIALGTAKLFGFRLMVNFRYPFFATNIGDFWRRWHISLTTWFRDYIYFPLGGSREGMAKHIRNIMIVFLVSGLWHGAQWTFVLWGAVMGAAYVVYSVVGQKIRIPALLGWFLTTATFVLSLIFFRSESIVEAFAYVKRLFSGIGDVAYMFEPIYAAGAGLIALMFCYEWLGRNDEHPLARYERPATIFAALFIIIFITLTRIDSVAHEFIYFQF